MARPKKIETTPRKPSAGDSEPFGAGMGLGGEEKPASSTSGNGSARPARKNAPRKAAAPGKDAPDEGAASASKGTSRKQASAEEAEEKASPKPAGKKAGTRSAGTRSAGTRSASTRSASTRSAGKKRSSRRKAAAPAPASGEPLSIIADDGSIGDHDHGLTNDELVHCYRTMLLVRAFDDICLKLQRSGRIGFSIPNKGIEGKQVGAASAFSKSDWFFPSYRDFGMAMYHGVPAVEMMHNMYGNAQDSARGRQMPVHFSFVDPIKFVSISSPIGTHIPQAVGAAYAFRVRGEEHAALVSFGDGGTSSLGFHSGMNFAGVWKAPVVFLCQNNGWAISCPIDHQTASDGFAIKAAAYGMPGVVVDGNDLLAVRQVMREAAERARKGEGPTLVECKTYRMGGHSTSDDPTRYVPAEELAEWAERDPVERFRRFLEHAGLWSEGLEGELQASVAAEVKAASDEAEATQKPGLETIFSDVYEDLPDHLRAQGEATFDLARRKGDAAAGDGAFPL